jgi:glycosyltransferase involved in cell wall biosynthesis
MSKVKVLQLITGLDVGGAEKVVFDLSHSLKELGHEVYIIGISDKRRLLKLFLEKELNVKILDIGKTLPSFITGYIKLLQFIKAKEIRVIHVHMFHALIMAFLVKIMVPQVKIIYTSHNFNIGSKFRKMLVKITKNIRNVDIIFSQNMWNDSYKKNAYIIPNGIDTSLYELNVNKNVKFTYLSIGRIEPVKNHFLLVDAAVYLQRYLDFEIHIVGDGYLKNDLISYIKENKVDSKIKLLGYRSDINLICNQSHIFVLPSLWEGLPISLLEAAASGLPVVTTSVGSIPQVVDENSGYFATVNNFAEKMKEVYDNYTEAVVKGKLLRHVVKEKYGLQLMVDEHLKIYNSL